MIIEEELLMEWGIVADEVVKVSKDLYQKILDAVYESKPKISRINGLPFFEGTFEYADKDGNDIFRGVKSLKVDYLMYAIANINEYNALVIGSEGSNSESDFESRYLKVVSALYRDGTPISTYMREIFHEVKHIYQRAMEMESREDLYQKVLETVNNTTVSEIKRYVATTLYYTFVHEQDAFVSGFYGFLEQNGPMDFEDALYYSEYRNLKDTHAYVSKYSNRREIRDVLGEFGFTPKTYNKRVHYALKRIKKKMSNAYKKYALSNRKFHDSILRASTSLQEEYNHYYPGIECGIESIYNYGN